MTKRPVRIDPHAGNVDEGKPRKRLERRARLDLAALHTLEQLEHPIAIHTASEPRTVSQCARTG